MGLTTQDQILIEQRVANEAKSTGVAYALWFFLGLAGAHRFYLGQKRTGFVMLALFVVGMLTVAIGIGSVFVAIVAVWALVDAFLIPGMVKKHRDDTRRTLGVNAMLSDAAGAPVDTSKWSKADREKFMSQRIGGSTTS